MKKCLLSMIALLACVALFTSCEDNDLEKRQVTFTATMPADDLSSTRPGCIINGVQDADGFNLKAQWKDGDNIQIFVRQDGKVFQADSPSAVSDISSDGKTCTFELVLPKSVNRDKDYDIIGVTGAEAYIDDTDVIASCTLTRVGIDGSDAPLLPMWFTCKKGNNQAKFRHMCAYEVLYVNNSSESSITFRHAGFNVLTPWYKYSDRVVLTGDVFSGYEAGQNDIESNEITIAPRETGTILTWYIPRFDVNDETTEATINDARLKAVVNGGAVITADVIKSYKKFARGNAYYMEVNWDGSTLYFTNDFCPDGNHPHVIDLGLPSGTKWACCNVGANSPSERGDYFAWGETSPKTAFGEYNYKWYIAGDDHRITKYCSNSDYGTVDNIIGLEPEDDAAYVNWGPEWRTPGTAQIYELLENCTSEWIKVNGMSGCLIKSKTTNGAIFFPAAGWYTKYGFRMSDIRGEYWSRVNPYISLPNMAYLLAFNYGEMGWIRVGYTVRFNGLSVRAVYVGQ